jgi:RNA polymerase sigma-70 factor (ECF subfamily)
MQRLLDAGRRAWPDIHFPVSAFERYFAKHARPDCLPAEARAADMYLACACAQGESAAVAALERTFMSHVARAVASVRGSAPFVEEVLQETRERVLVGQDAATRIAGYAGKGSLRSWLCAVAIRVALSCLRREGSQRNRTCGDRDDWRLADPGPELEYLHRRYEAAFLAALRTGIEGLMRKEQTLLRLNVAEGMSIDEIGVLYGVDRSTAARWLAAARVKLTRRVRGELRAGCGFGASELEAVARELCSQLEVSIVTLLREERADAGRPEEPRARMGHGDHCRPPT